MEVFRNSEEMNPQVREMLENEFTIDEDVFVILYFDLNTPASTAKQDIQRIYMRRSHLPEHDPLVFLKDPSYELFKARLNILKSAGSNTPEGKRYFWLKRFAKIEFDRQEMLRNSTKPKIPGPPLTDAQKQAQKEARSNEATALIQNLCEKHSNAFGKEKLDIFLRGKDFGNVTIETFKRPLVEKSKWIKMMTEGINKVPTQPSPRSNYSSPSHVSNSMYSNVIPNQSIVITDKLPKYQNIETFNHFDPKNFQRFVLFCLYCNVYQRSHISQILESELQQVCGQIDTFVKEECLVMKNLINTHNNNLEKLYLDDQKHSMRSVIVSETNNNPKETRIEWEKQRLVQKKDKMKGEVEAFYLSQASRLAIIADELKQKEGTRISVKEAKVEHIEQVIFPKDQVLKMLILAEDLLCEELCQACVQIIVKDMDYFIKMPEYQCMLIRENTHQLIISLLLTPYLGTMLTNNLSLCPFPSLVNRELKYRRLMSRENLKTIPYHELKEMITVETDNVMREVLHDELEHRSHSHPYVLIETDSEKFINAPGIEVLNDSKNNGLVVIANGVKRYSTVHATHFRTSETDGRWFFELFVNTLDITMDACLSVGWDTLRREGEKVMPGISPGAGGYGCALQTDGIVHYGGKGEFMNCPYTVGDVIGCALDQFTRSLSFYKNGSKVQTRFHNGDFLIPEELYVIGPCACFISRRTTQVTFNFTGPFLYPVQGFMAYGRVKDQ